MIDIIFRVGFFLFVAIETFRWGLKLKYGYVSIRAGMSQLLNFALGGKIRHTFSGRVGTRIKEGAKPVWLWRALGKGINALFIDDDHVARSAERLVMREFRGTIPLLDPLPEAFFRD